MIEPAAITYELTCEWCSDPFTLISTIGPALTCDPCRDVLLEIIWGHRITGRDKFGNVALGEPL